MPPEQQFQGSRGARSLPGLSHSSGSRRSIDGARGRRRVLGVPRADGWKPATFGVEAHRTTRFPLDGRHAAVACAKCHPQAGQATLYRVRFGACTDCHRDQHDVQLAGSPDQNRCESCHTVNGFRPAIFSQARHAQTRMPLGGAHLAVPCQEVSLESEPRTARPGRFRFRTPPAGAVTRTRTRASSRSGCRRSKSTVPRPAARPATAFVPGATSPSSITPTTTFRLTGTHRGVTCEQCHRPADPKFPVKGVVFRVGGHAVLRLPRGRPRGPVRLPLRRHGLRPMSRVAALEARRVRSQPEHEFQPGGSAPGSEVRPLPQSQQPDQRKAGGDLQACAEGM